MKKRWDSSKPDFNGKKLAFEGALDCLSVHPAAAEHVLPVIARSEDAARVHLTYWFAVYCEGENGYFAAIIGSRPPESFPKYLCLLESMSTVFSSLWGRKIMAKGRAKQRD